MAISYQQYRTLYTEHDHSIWYDTELGMRLVGTSEGMKMTRELYMYLLFFEINDII